MQSNQLKSEKSPSKTEKPHVLLSKSMEPTIGRLKNKRAREAFAYAELVNGIAAQIRVIRQQRGWSQKELAEKLETTQGVVSRLEDPSYGRYSLKTLLNVAAVFDVALVTRFLSFSQAIPAIWNTKSEALEADSFEEEIDRICYYTKSNSVERKKFNCFVSAPDWEIRKELEGGDVIKSTWVHSKLIENIEQAMPKFDSLSLNRK